jgi:hypothetical protein
MEKQRDYSKILMFIYALSVLLTLAVVLLIGLPYLRVGHAWISISALILAETVIYLLALHYVSNHKRSSGMIPGYLAFSAVASLYLIAILVFIVVFSLVLDVSTTNYGLLHIALLAVAGIMSGFFALYFRHAEHQENESRTQVQWIRGMQSAILTVKQELEGWSDEARGSLRKELEALEEKIRYSDPMSHPELLDMEKVLLGQVYELSSAVRQLAIGTMEVSGESERLSRQVREITNGLANRNQQLIQLK